MEVQILCSKMIKPSAPTLPHLRILKLSPFDQIQYSVKMPLIFYYSRESFTSTEEIERHTDRLETSLSETLTRFYPLAGRYIKDGNWVDCNDEGVEYLEAKVKVRLSEFLSRRDEMIHQLVWLAGGEFTSSIASVQINKFECGGLAIASRVSHHLFDGFSAINFITSWATASRQGTDEVIMPNFDLSSILPADNLPVMKPLMPPPMGSDNGVTRRLVIHEAKIWSLKARAHDPRSQREATRVELVTALLWRALMAASRAKHGRLRSSLASNAINLRPKIIPPLPPVCCGNLHGKVIAKFMEDSNNAELPELKDLVGLLRDAFTKFKEKVVAREDALATLVKIRNEIHETVKDGDVDLYLFTSWRNFPLYKADFGWGKPVWVSRSHWPLAGITMVDSEDGDGIEVWVTLNKKDMPHFMQCEDVLAITS